jgi:predicted XRE-type DNA-binding protein
VANYLDGSSAGGSGNNSQYGREIDVMETSWNGYGATPSTAPGPQVNLPNGNTTGWLQSPVNGQNGVNQKAAIWSDVGGAPTSDFVTFGVLIQGDQIYFYANKPNGDQWYSIGPITKTNTAYQQEGPFVPYIGTWNNTNPSTSAPDGGFVTGYKNFVYVANSDAKIAGFNPKDNPEKFGSALKTLSTSLEKPTSSTNTSLSNASTVGELRSQLNMKLQAVLAQGSATELSASDVATILGVSKSKLSKAMKLAPASVKSSNGKINLSKLSKFLTKNSKAASLLTGKSKGKSKKSSAKRSS